MGNRLIPWNIRVNPCRFPHALHAVHQPGAVSAVQGVLFLRMSNLTLVQSFCFTPTYTLIYFPACLPFESKWIRLLPRRWESLRQQMTSRRGETKSSVGTAILNPKPVRNARNSKILAAIRFVIEIYFKTAHTQSQIQFQYYYLKFACLPSHFVNLVAISKF